MTKISAFLLGMIEFRSDCTTGFYYQTEEGNWDSDFGLLECYDSGRELAHKLTLRRYET